MSGFQRLATLTAALGLASHAQAGGEPPTARPDSATVTPGGTTSVLDSGAASVLANDSDPEGDTLTAVLERPPPSPGAGDGGNDDDRVGDGDDHSGDDEGEDRGGDDDDGDGGNGGGDDDDDGDGSDDDDAAGGRDGGDDDDGDDDRDDDDDRDGDDDDRDDDNDDDDDRGNRGRGNDGDRDDRGRGRGNDRDDDRRGQGAPLVQKPSHGTVTLRPDGTFVYRHDGGAAREDAFEYFAFDGTSYSPPTRVTVRIQPPPDDPPPPPNPPPSARFDLRLTVTAAPNPALVASPPAWELRVDNGGPGDAPAMRLQASWYGSAGALTLHAPAECSVNGNRGATPALDCAVPALPAGGSLRLSVATEQAVPGDQAVAAALEPGDSSAGNDRAVGSVTIAGGYLAGPAQVLAVPARALAAADLDGDGDLDLAAVTRDRTLWFRNQGERFADSSTEIDARGGAVLLAGDWNGDGAADLAVAHGDDGDGRLYIGRGDGAFQQPAPLPAPLARGGVAADLTGDGVVELAFATQRGVIELRNDGSGAVSARRLSERPSRHLAAGDFDQNGWQDLAVAHESGIELLLNRNGALSAAAIRDGGAAGVTASDADGDGDPDLLLAMAEHGTDGPRDPILLNTAGAFATAGTLGASPTLKLLTGDLNGDGRADVVALQRASAHALYFGASDGYRLQPAHLRAGGVTDGVLADLAGDGVLTLLLAREQAGVVEIYPGIGRGTEPTTGSRSSDVRAPQIELNGPSAITIKVNETYADLGARATDDVDGDLTSAIVVHNPVDPRIVGTYEVVYRVVDKAGNTAEAVRTVTVAPEAESSGGGGLLDLLTAVLLGVLSAAARIVRRNRRLVVRPPCARGQRPAP